ncbi:hypothetical protein Hanom_Chr06g00533091 [Helianthus anomalus]
MQRLQLVHESPGHLHTCLRSASLRDMVSDSNCNRYYDAYSKPNFQLQGLNYTVLVWCFILSC